MNSMTSPENKVLIETLNSQNLAKTKYKLAKTSEDDDLLTALTDDALAFNALPYSLENSTVPFQIFKNLLRNKHLSVENFKRILDAAKDYEVDGLCSMAISKGDGYEKKSHIDSEKLDILISYIVDDPTYGYGEFVFEVVELPYISNEQLTSIMRDHGHVGKGLLSEQILKQSNFNLEENVDLIDWSHLPHLSGIAARKDLTVDVAKKVIEETNKLTELSYHHPFEAMLLYGAKDSGSASDATVVRQQILDLLIREPRVREKYLRRLVEKRRVLPVENEDLLYDLLDVKGKRELFQRNPNERFIKKLTDDSDPEVAEMIAGILAHRAEMAVEIEKYYAENPSERLA